MLIAVIFGRGEPSSTIWERNVLKMNFRFFRSSVSGNPATQLMHSLRAYWKAALLLAVLSIAAAWILIAPILSRTAASGNSVSSESSAEPTASPSAEPTATPNAEPTATPDPYALSEKLTGLAGRITATDGEAGVGSQRDVKLVALTFDDGPSEDSAQFVQELDSLGAKCTFFLQGYRVEAYPDAVRAMAKSGHQIASHSYNHPNLTQLSADNISWQISETEALLSAIDGKQNHYLRCPYGESNDTVKSIVQSPIIHWCVDSEDWKTQDAAAIRDAIVSNVYDGAIVLAHEIYKTSREGCLAAIRDLQAQGYEFVTVEALLKRRGVNIEIGTTYYDAQNKGITFSARDVDLYFDGIEE